MKKYILPILALSMAFISVVQGSSAMAQKEENVWVLVDVIDYNREEDWEIANEHESYNNEFSCSEGDLSVKRTYIGRSEDWRNPPKKKGEGVRITATFSRPPEILYPDEEISLSVAISTSENTLSYFAFSGYASANFDNPDLLPGYISRSAIRFLTEDDKLQYDMSANNNYETINGTFTAKSPMGKADGERIALRQEFYMGVSMGTYYIYEWREANYQPETTPKQTNQTKMSTKPSEIPFAGDPDMKRSGVHISDIYGYVLVELYDDDGYFIDDYTPVLGEELAVNAIIITHDDSGVQLSLRDMTTYMIKSNSMIRIGDQSEQEGVITRLIGHVWCNVKQMIRDGSMDIEMSQAVAGIKGTTFILEDDGVTSTVKVFEGEVIFTPHNGEEPVPVTNGEQLSATASSLGTIMPFDIDTELAKWDGDVQEMTRQAIAEYRSPVINNEPAKDNKGFLVLISLVLVIAVLIVGSIVAVILIRSKTNKKTKGAAPYGYYPPGQNTPTPYQHDVKQLNIPDNTKPVSRYCKSCGSFLSPNSQFCTECGQSIT